MFRILRDLNKSLAFVVLALGSSGSQAAVELLAIPSPTPGVEGFTTYDLIATTDEGYFNGFDFGDVNGAGRGMTGSSFQQTDGVYSTRLEDTGWLVDSSDGIQLGMQESGTELRGVFVFTGSSGLRDTFTQWRFARLVTDRPEDVMIEGQLLLTPFSGVAIDSSIIEIDISLPLQSVRLIPEPTTAAMLLGIMGLTTLTFKR